MPEDKDPAANVAEVAEVIEKLVEDDKDEPKGKRTTPSNGLLSDHKIRSLAALILAGASLVATLGTFLKTCDHSVTENSYNTLSESIKTLSENEQKNHDDLVALHGYLNGLTHTHLVVPFKDDGDRDGDGIPDDPPAMKQTVTISAPPLPTVHPSAAPVAPPPFSQASKGK